MLQLKKYRRVGVTIRTFIIVEDDKDFCEEANQKALGDAEYLIDQGLGNCNVLMAEPTSYEATSCTRMTPEEVKDYFGEDTEELP